MEEVDEHVRKIYPEIPNSGFVAQSVNNFPYPCEKEMESAENSITLDKMRASQKKISSILKGKLKFFKILSKK